MTEESMDVEFDSEFMRLYYNKTRAVQILQQQKTDQNSKGEQIRLGTMGFVLNPFGSRVVQLKCLKTCEGSKKRRYMLENSEQTSKIESDKVVTILEYPTPIRQGTVLSIESAALKSNNCATQMKRSKMTFPKSRLTYKSTVFKEHSPAFIRMVFRQSSVEVDIFDADSVPVLKRQIVRASNSYEVIRFRVIKEIIMREITGKEDSRIPQIISSSEEMNIFLCPMRECNQGFTQLHIAKSHALSHLDHRPYCCNFYGCGWTFTKQSHLQRHFVTHENVKNYPCKEPGCDKIFTTIYNLNEHKKKRHILPATKPCPVSLCQETFRNEKELRTHCKKHNEEEAPFKCSHMGCKRSFFFQSTIEAHAKTHLEENQHICTYNNCNKTFQQAYRLKEHMRCHTGTKPYKCTIGKCAKGFTTASKLKRHEKSHFDDKNHYCNMEGCDKAFKRSDHLNEHIRLVHKVQTQKGSSSSTGVESSTYSLPTDMFATKPSSSMDNTPLIPKTKDISKYPTAETLIITSEDEETDLTKYLLTFDSTKSSSSCSNLASSSKTEDELLDEAIRSLGVPEMKLETDLFLDEPLDLSDFSTVNLRDLQ